MGSKKVQLIPLLGDQEAQPIEIPDTGLVIGRSEECGFMIEGEGISRRHARVVYVGDQLCVEDLESVNGVMVNGQQIHRRQILHVGDVMQICEHEFRVAGASMKNVGAGKRITLLLAVLAVLVVMVVGVSVFLSSGGTRDEKLYTLRLRSDPPGADVYDHGKKIATTPYDMKKVKKGRYWLLFRKEGYKDLQAKVEVPQGKTVQIHALEPASDDPGFLDIVTLPANAEVYIDGKFYGNSVGRGSQNEQSAPLRVEGIDLSEEHQAYIVVDGERSRTYYTEKGKTTLSIVLWRPDYLVTTKDDVERLGMVRKRDPNGDLHLAVTPKRDVIINKDRILEEKRVTPTKLRDNRGVKTISDPKEGLELIVDPFPDEK